MENRKIRVGITHGDINGVGYEVILKTFSDPTMLELCTPVVYGSPKVAAYHRKAMEIQTSFSIVNSAEEVQDGRVNVVNCIEEELKVELTKPTPEAGKAALAALERALADYREGLFDVLVTAPINKHTIQSDAFHFPGHTEYIEERVGEGQKALMILLKGDFRVALVTGHVPVRDIAGELTKELIMEKMEIFHRSLKKDFGIDNPRIAVFSLNPHAGDNGLLGTEEQEVIIPAMKEMIARGVQCFGPYPADGFMGSGNYTHFDGILAMYHDQGLAPFKALPWMRCELHCRSAYRTYFACSRYGIRYCRKRHCFGRFFPSGSVRGHGCVSATVPGEKRNQCPVRCASSIMRNEMTVIN